MVENHESNTLVKTSVTLNKFLEEAKTKGSSHARISNNKEYHVNSIRKIALEAELEVNTVASIFNGKRVAKFPTLLLIIQALGKSLTEFARAFDRVTDSDIQKFKERTPAKKTAPKKKSTRK